MKKKVLGVLIPTVDAYNYEKLWKGMVDYSSKNDINLLFFFGSPLNAPKKNVSAYNSIYNLAKTTKIDGLIIASGSLSNYIGKEKLESFLSRFGDLPKVSISHAVQSASNILINNKAGMEQLVDHLIEKHNYQNIAFITGLMSNEEAKPRLNGYKTSLIKHNYKINNELIYYGDWTKVSIIPIAQEIIHAKAKPDCIVCSNDEMAMALYDELKKHDSLNYINYAITGFDNLQGAESNNPPLTTIAQPLCKMGYTSVQLLSEYIDTRISDDILIAPELIVRESCGCLNLIPNLDETISNFEVISETAITSSNLNSIFNELQKPFRVIYPEITTWKNYPFKDLLNALYTDIQNHCVKGEFIKLFYKTLNADSEVIEKSNIIRAILYTITNQLCDNLQAVKEMKTVTNIYSLSNIIINQINSRYTVEFSKKLAQSRKITQQNTRMFNAITDYKTLFKTLKNALKLYDISVFALCLYDECITSDKVDNFEYPPQMNMPIAYFNGEFYNDLTFETKDIVPDFMNNQSSPYDYVLYPIVFSTHQFGYIITNTETYKNLNLISILDQLSSSLERIQWYNKLAEYNSKLKNLSMKDELTGLFNRRGFYDLGQKKYDQVRKSNQGLVVIYLDLDGLKQINDNYGHNEGDFAIHKIGSILKNISPKKAIISRIGGDEYTIIYTHNFHQNDSDENTYDECTMEQYKKKIYTKINEYVDKANSKISKPYLLSVSLGISIFTPNLPVSFTDLITEADKALYMDKDKDR